MTPEQIIQLAHELIEHLEYCGWGDRWEREVSEELRRQAYKFQEEHPDVR